MEHRCSVRLPIAMDVLLYHNNIPVVHCKTNDIGPEGMFVKSGSLKYRINTVLKVEFHTKKGVETKSYMLSAMVVHHANNGLGLMFPGDDTKAMLAWHDMVRNLVIQSSVEETNTLHGGSDTKLLNSGKDDIKSHKESFSFA